MTNDSATLGLIATTATSSAASIATAAVNNGIIITSVSAGSATVTCSDGTNAATISVTVSADGSIACTVNYYGFVDLSSADINTIAGTSILALSTSTNATFTGSVTLSSGALLYESAASKLKLRSDANGDSSSLYIYTGITAASVPATVTISAADAYIKIPNSAAGTFTVYAQVSGSSSSKVTSSDTLTAVLCDQNGTILDSETETIANSTNTAISLTATVTSAVTAVYIIDYRTVAYGGLDIYSVSFTPAN